MSLTFINSVYIYIQIKVLQTKFLIHTKNISEATGYVKHSILVYTYLTNLNVRKFDKNVSFYTIISTILVKTLT